MEFDWKKLIARKDIDLIDVCVPNVLHHDLVIAAAKAGKMVVCEKPLAMNVAEAEEMVAAVEKAGVANMVSFNYRRVPAISLAKQIIDEGRDRPPVPLPRHLQSGLHHLGRRAAGRHGPLAARRPRGRLRRDRRPAGPLHRHGRVAQRPDPARRGPHRDLHQGAEARRDGQDRAGDDRRRLHVPGHLRQRLAAAPSRAPATPAAARTTTPSRSTARTARSSSIWKIRTFCNISATPIRPPARRSKTTSPAGSASTSPISSIPT